jgi:hypothetical protein
VSCPSTPSSTPTTITAPVAKAAVSSPAEKVTAAMLWAASGRPASRRRPCRSARGAALHRVGPDHRGTDDGLGHRAEHLADPLADQPERGVQPLLHGSYDEDQRQEAQVDDEGQLPGPEQHQRGGQHQLGAAHQDEQARPTA